MMQPLPDVNERRQITERLIHYIQRASLQRTFASISSDIGLDEKTIRNVFHDHVANLEQTIEFHTPEWLGINERTLGGKPRCICINVKERTVIGLLPSRRYTTVLQYLQQMKNRHEIQVVTMDMWKPYRDAVATAMPQAQIVIDKFHVVRMANQGVELVRKAIRAGLSDRQRRTLMHDRYVLLKRQHDLTPQDHLVLAAWLQAHPPLAEAYRLKEAFYAIWETRSALEAETRYQHWLASVPDELRKPFGPLITALGHWHREIFAYFMLSGQATNAATEAVNGLAKLLVKMDAGIVLKLFAQKYCMEWAISSKYKYLTANWSGILRCAPLP